MINSKDIIKNIWRSDLQAGIYRNIDEIKWVKPVHELLTGAKITTAITFEEDFAMIHKNNLEKKIQQNRFYNEEISCT